jgi:Tfp pilus assembly protein PilF
MDSENKVNAELHYNLGTQILSKLNSSSTKYDYIKAVNHLQEAVELDPNYAHYFHNLAYAWYKFAEYKYSIITSKYQFKSLDELTKTALKLIKNGKNKKAEKLQERYVKEHGQEALIEGYLVFALEAVDKALEIQYNFPQAHNTRAMIFAKLGRIDEAIQATEVALSQEPSYENALNNQRKMKDLKKVSML